MKKLRNLCHNFTFHSTYSIESGNGVGIIKDHLLKEQQVMEWYEKYYRDIFRFIFYMLGDRQSCEDFVHDTFLRAYKSFDRFENQSNVKTWLFSIAKHLVMDEIRRRKRRQFLSLFSGEQDFPSSVNVEQYIENKDAVERVLKAIQNMKPNYRLVIALRKIEDLSTKETADILGWSETKVRKTLSRALASLKEMEPAEGGHVYEQSQ